VARDKEVTIAIQHDPLDGTLCNKTTCCLSFYELPNIFDLTNGYLKMLEGGKKML
jgi:hypothetical protein